MIIQHNMSSEISNRRLNLNRGSAAKNAEKLASGYRVNRAADNSSGLAVSEKLRSQIRGLRRASDNARDGVELMRTADGALAESQAIVHRIRELAVQAANDTNRLEDREAIQVEIDALIEEIDRIAEQTEYNKKKLLNGNCDSQSTNHSINAAAAVPSGITWVTVTSNVVSVSKPLANNTQAATLDSILKNSIVPNVVNMIRSTFSTLATNANISPTIGLELYNDAGTSVLASVGMSYSHSGGTLASSARLGLSVNAASLTFINGDTDLDAQSRRALESTIAHEMMHAFMYDALSAGMVGATNGRPDAANRFPLWFIEGMAQTMAGGFCTDNPWCAEYFSKATIPDIQATMKDGNHNLAGAATNSRGAYSTGYLAVMYLGYMAGGGTLTAGSIAGGINRILGNMIGRNGQVMSLDTVINTISKGKYTSYRDFEAKFGDVDSATFVMNLKNAVINPNAPRGYGAGSVLTGDLKAWDLIPNGPGTSPVYVIDATVAMANATPRNWNTGGAINPAAAGGGAAGPGGAGGGGTAGDGGGLYFQIGANEWQGVFLDIADSRSIALGIDFLSVLSHEGSANTIATCDVALSHISANRSRIGACINRLEYATAVDDNAGENLQSAESRIRDTDMASEMTEYSKNNILAQASQAMLAQSMNMNQSVIQLLQ